MYSIVFQNREEAKRNIEKKINKTTSQRTILLCATQIAAVPNTCRTRCYLLCCWQQSIGSHIFFSADFCTKSKYRINSCTILWTSNISNKHISNTDYLYVFFCRRRRLRLLLFLLLHIIFFVLIRHIFLLLLLLRFLLQWLQSRPRPRVIRRLSYIFSGARSPPTTSTHISIRTAHIFIIMCQCRHCNKTKQFFFSSCFDSFLVLFGDAEVYDDNKGRQKKKEEKKLRGNAYNNMRRKQNII